MSRRQKILVVDDDGDLRRMFRMALSLGGFETQEAGDGYTALHLIDQQRFDAIVLDLGLPSVSGYVVLQDLAAHAHTRSIPVIVVTGILGEHQLQEAACVLHKPVMPDRLVDSVRSCIASGRSKLGT